MALIQSLRRPYLLEVCDNKIKEQERVIDEINDLFPDPVKTDRDKSQTEPSATDQAATDNADKSIHTIAGGSGVIFAVIALASMGVAIFASRRKSNQHL